MKLARMVEMCLNEMYRKVRRIKHLSHSLPIQIGLKQGDALTPLLFNLALEYAIRDRLCGLVVRVLDYRSRGPGFESQALQKK
jgi:hypothetical protein